MTRANTQRTAARSPWSWVPALAALLVATGLAGARASDPPRQVAPEVRQQLAELARAYHELPAYADAGHVTSRIVVNGEARLTEADVPIRFARPNRLVLEVEGVGVVCDGETLRTTRGAVRKYRNEPAPAMLSLGLLGGGPLGSVLTGGPAEHPAGLVLSLLLADDAASRLLDGVTASRIETGARFEGVADPLTAIVLERGNKPGLRLGIEPGTRRLRAIDLLVDPAKLAENAPPGTQVADWSMSWRSGPIATEPPAASAFAIAPPPGFTAVATAQAKQAAEAEKHPLVGNPAPDFRFDVIAGKATKPVAKADLAGQIVVLDFWATWCGPCRLELPEIQALCQRLAKLPAGKLDLVRIIAVSQDRAPDDGSPVRALVETTLAELKLDLATSPVARVALDPDQLAGDAFKVTGLPTLVVIDNNGVVQAVHVGYREGIGDELFQQIETLLSGKPLVEDKPAAGPQDR